MPIVAATLRPLPGLPKSGYKLTRAGLPFWGRYFCSGRTVPGHFVKGPFALSIVRPFGSVERFAFLRCGSVPSGVWSLVAFHEKSDRSQDLVFCRQVIFPAESATVAPSICTLEESLTHIRCSNLTGWKDIAKYLGMGGARYRGTNQSTACPSGGQAFPGLSDCHKR